MARWLNFFTTHWLWPARPDRPPDPGDRPAAAAGRRLPDLCRAQGDGGDAAAQGPNVVGPFGLLQPFADGLKLLLKETMIPSAPTGARVHHRADDHLHPGAGRLGGDPVRRRLGARRHQRRHPLPVRDLLARRLRHHHGRLGDATRNTPSSAPCARRRRWCPTRSRSASS